MLRFFLLFLFCKRLAAQQAATDAETLTPMDFDTPLTLSMGGYGENFIMATSDKDKDKAKKHKLPEKPFVVPKGTIVEVEPIRHCLKFLAGKKTKDAIERLDFVTKQCHYVNMFDQAEPVKIECPKGLHPDVILNKCVGEKREPPSPQCGHKEGQPKWWRIESKYPVEDAYKTSYHSPKGEHHKKEPEEPKGPFAYCIKNEVYFPKTHCPEGFKKKETEGKMEVCIIINEVPPIHQEICSYISTKQPDDTKKRRALEAQQDNPGTEDNPVDDPREMDLVKMWEEGFGTAPGRDLLGDKKEHIKPGFKKHCEIMSVCPEGFTMDKFKITCKQYMGTAPKAKDNCHEGWYFRAEFDACVKHKIDDAEIRCPYKFKLDPLTGDCVDQVKEKDALKIECPKGYFNAQNKACAKVTIYKPALECEHVKDGGFVLDEKREKCVMAVPAGTLIYKTPGKKKEKKEKDPNRVHHRYPILPLPANYTLKFSYKKKQ
mmetsp:Transcript_41948/g.104717  ORF Transcript_41948/g.104717 Transcript_41948/m.104717 type:complete len:487 (-) Transcript_41948:365-1825(-)